MRPRYHDGDYPHSPSCSGCREAKACNSCGKALTQNPVNGRCRGCHEELRVAARHANKAVNSTGPRVKR
jgi:hypothetical protein